MLIVGRAIAGLGASGLTNGALTILAAIAPIHKRPGKALYIYCPLKKLKLISRINGHHDGR